MSKIIELENGCAIVASAPVNESTRETSWRVRDEECNVLFTLPPMAEDKAKVAAEILIPLVGDINGKAYRAGHQAGVRETEEKVAYVAGLLLSPIARAIGANGPI